MLKQVYHFLLLTLIIVCFSCENSNSDSLSRDGVFTTPSGTSTIEGELFLPAGEGPFPLMIIVPGSGNEPRQEFEFFAPMLNQNGYALYIYDKRGVGGSTGSYPPDELESQLEFLTARAQDVLGILDLMKTHSKIDTNRMGLFGSSQGAWVNSVVHNMSSDLAYIAMASGGVASTGLERFYDGLTDDPNLSIDDAISQLPNYNGLTGFDPISIITGMELPVLWIYGDQDRSHPARYDIQVLGNLNKSNFTVQIFQDTDHDLLNVNTGQLNTTIFQSLGQWLTTNN